MMKDKLVAEGITGVEYLVITAPGFGWADHAEGYDKVDFSIMPDPVGSVFTLMGATYYDAYMVDKKGRLVTKQAAFGKEHFEDFAKRIRSLDAE